MRTVLWLVLALTGMVILQQSFRVCKMAKVGPGISRGDMVLSNDVLPDEIGGWKKAGFTPARNAALLPQGQFWWSFTWQYQRESLGAVVSLDQADWDSWHELTECYRGHGWLMTDRVAKTSPSGMIPFVQATFRNAAGQFATLMFMEFDEEGCPIPSPYSRFPVDKQKLKYKPVGEILSERFTGQPAIESKRFHRVLQTQIFVPSERELTEIECDSAVELLLESQQRFRAAWVALRRQELNL